MNSSYCRTQRFDLRPFLSDAPSSVFKRLRRSYRLYINFLFGLSALRIVCSLALITIIYNALEFISYLICSEISYLEVYFLDGLSLL